MQNDTASFSLRRTLAMAICLFLPLIAYPTLLVIAQDFPGFPRFGALRYFYSPELSRFESWALAFGFISIFFLGFTFLFAKAARVLFLGLASVLSMIAFVFIALSFDNISIFPSPAPPNKVCGIGSFGCFPILQGGLITLSIVLAVLISERLIHKLFHQNVLGRVPPSIPPRFLLLQSISSYILVVFNGASFSMQIICPIFHIKAWRQRSFSWRHTLRYLFSCS